MLVAMCFMVCGMMCMPIFVTNASAEETTVVVTLDANGGNFGTKTDRYGNVSEITTVETELWMKGDSVCNTWIQYSAKKSLSDAKKLTTTATKGYIKNAKGREITFKKGKNYYIRVRAYEKDSNGNKVYGVQSLHTYFTIW